MFIHAPVYLKKPRPIHRTGDYIGHSFCQNDDSDAEITDVSLQSFLKVGYTHIGQQFRSFMFDGCQISQGDAVQL